MHAQIDAGNLSRILNGQQKPSPETLKKLSEKAYNDITYEQLMEAAGYISNTNKESSSSDGIPSGIYLRLAKEAEEMQLSNDDLNLIIGMFKI
ncbi:hypothetical protein [Desulfitobacterium chlororespirans]|uniref:hypothetical protein n=1 Tax=Desulfitobacterium chlororespirans TaxID=51616 RepID=UPI0009324184|nr:hypothetical protein [Desulfitobacterium chlororespirans]